MPGVLIIEAMAQVGGLLLMDTIENPEDKVVYFMSLDKVKWRRPVTPGDQLVFELELLQFRRSVCRMRGEGFVDGQSGGRGGTHGKDHGPMSAGIPAGRQYTGGGHPPHRHRGSPGGAGCRGGGGALGPGGPPGPGGGGTVIGPGALVEQDTTIGQECRIHKGAVLGTDPQDLKYDGEDALSSWWGTGQWSGNTRP
jgi:hypothetical protein